MEVAVTEKVKRILMFDLENYCLERTNNGTNKRIKERKNHRTNELILSQTIPGIYVSAARLLKTLWEKEKLLVSSNFSFSHSAFYPFGYLSAIFITF